MATFVPPKPENLYQFALYLIVLWVVFIVVVWFTYPEKTKYSMISIFAGLVAITTFFYIIGRMRHS